MGYQSGDIVVWDVASERAQLARRAHNDYAVVSVAGDGKTFASGGREGSIKIWDLVSGRELGDPLTVDGDVEALVFVDEGRRLAARFRGATAEDVDIRACQSILWQADAAIDDLCNIAGRNLTIDEWRQFLPDQAPSKTCDGCPLPGKRLNGPRQASVCGISLLNQHLFPTRWSHRVTAGV